MSMVKMIWIHFDNPIITIGKKVSKPTSRHTACSTYKNNSRSRPYIIRTRIDLKIWIAGNESIIWWTLFKHIVAPVRSINPTWLFRSCSWKSVFDSINLKIKKKTIPSCKSVVVSNIAVAFSHRVEKISKSNGENAIHISQQHQKKLIQQWSDTYR